MPSPTQMRWLETVLGGATGLVTKLNSSMTLLRIRLKDSEKSKALRLKVGDSVSFTGTLDSWEGLAALAEIPEDDRDESVRRSIARGAEFFLDRHLMEEGKVRYPPWFRIHYPNHYFYDVLVGLRILTRLGYGADPRLAPALRWLRSKRASDGTWALDAAHPDLDAAIAGYQYTRILFPMMLEPLHDPSRWATVEALGVLTRADVS